MKKIKITKKDWIYIAVIGVLAIVLWIFANLSGDRGSLVDELKFQMGLKQTEIDGYNDVIRDNDKKLSLAEAKLKAQAAAAAEKESEYLTSIGELKKLITVDRETKPVELTGNELDICNIRLDECMTQHTAAQLLLFSKDGIIKTWSEKFNLMSDNYFTCKKKSAAQDSIIKSQSVMITKIKRSKKWTMIKAIVVSVAAGYLLKTVIK